MSGLDETSVAIGRLQSGQDALQNTVGDMRTDLRELTASVQSLAASVQSLSGRQSRLKLTLKHWAVVIGLSSVGGGGIAHALRRLLP